jgi:hypothetical protein
MRSRRARRSGRPASRRPKYGAALRTKAIHSRDAAAATKNDQEHAQRNVAASMT